MSKGDKVIYMPINFALRVVDKENANYGKTATIIEESDRFGRYVIAFDDFPNCNHKERKNRFYATKEELILESERI